MSQIQRPVLQVIAICAMAVMLCASCATGARNAADTKSPEEIAQLYVELGTSALLRSDYPQAVEDLRKALTMDSKNAVAHNHLGLAYYALGKRDLAKAELELSIKYDPKYSDAYINLGNLALDKNDKKAARNFYNKALENLEYKYRHRAFTSLASLSISENNTEEARRLLYQSLQVNPDYCLSHFLLGTIFMRENNASRAKEEFSKSLVKTCVGNPEGHYQLGLAHMKLKEFDKARTEFVHLVEEYPQTLQAQKAGEHLKLIP